MVSIRTIWLNLNWWIFGHAGETVCGVCNWLIKHIQLTQSHISIYLKLCECVSTWGMTIKYSLSFLLCFWSLATPEGNFYFFSLCLNLPFHQDPFHQRNCKKNTLLRYVKESEKRSPWTRPFIQIHTKSQCGLFWAETLPPSKFCVNLSCIFFVILLTNKSTNHNNNKLFGGSNN